MRAGSEKQVFRPAGAGQDVLSVAWNYDGSLLSSLNKNGTVAVFDPRSAGEGALVRTLTADRILLVHHLTLLYAD